MSEQDDDKIFGLAGVAKLADALDSKSGIRKDVWVRTPPPVYSFPSVMSIK